MRDFASLARRGARQQQHQIGMLGARGPDLLAVDDVMVAVADRGGAQAERVGARGRLGDTECLQAQFAARNAGQIAFLLRGAAMPKKRAHRVHLRMTGRAVAAGGLDFLHDGGGGRHGQSAAAVLLRDQRGEKARFGQRRDELGRIGALAIELPPIFAGEIGAQCPHRFADRGEIGFAVRRRVRHRVPILVVAAHRAGILIFRTPRSANRDGRDKPGRDDEPMGACMVRAYLGAAVVDGDDVAFHHAGAKADDIAVAPHLGADGLAGEDRRGKAAGERR